MGWFTNMIIYCTALTIGATLFGLLSITINKIRYKLTYKIQSKELRKK